MPSLRANGKSRQSATSAYQPTQASARPSAGNAELTPTPSSPASPSPPRKGGDYVRRPMNPFMLYRSHVYRNGLIIEKHQTNLSAVVAKMWNALSEDEKAPFKAMAQQVKEQHMLQYPGYRYAPGQKMSESEAKAAKPESVSDGKGKSTTRASKNATKGRSKLVASPAQSTNNYSSSTTAAREMPQVVEAPLANTQTPTLNNPELLSASDDGSQYGRYVFDEDPLVVPSTTDSELMDCDHDAYYSLFPTMDIDFELADGEVLTPTFSYGFDNLMEQNQQHTKPNAATDLPSSYASTSAYNQREQTPVTIDNDSDEEWREIWAQCVVDYDS